MSSVVEFEKALNDTSYIVGLAGFSINRDRKWRRVRHRGGGSKRLDYRGFAGLFGPVE
jgi:hypothetical protein